MTFNHRYVGSSPTGLNTISGHRSMVGLLSSKQMMSVQVRLATSNDSNLRYKIVIVFHTITVYYNYYDYK